MPKPQRAARAFILFGDQIQEELRKKHCLPAAEKIVALPMASTATAEPRPKRAKNAIERTEYPVVGPRGGRYIQQAATGSQYVPTDKMDCKNDSSKVKQLEQDNEQLRETVSRLHCVSHHLIVVFT